MAKQSGIIKISGGIGDLSFYRCNGQDLVRRKGGASKDKIYRDPVFKRTRENMSEFGGCSTVAKALRSGFSSVRYLMHGYDMCGRLNRSMKLINMNSSGERGKRNIEIAKNKSILKGFEF